MPQNAIEIDRVCKRYVLGERHTTARDAIAAAARGVLNRKPPRPDTLWSLRDISLDVEKGEALGVIGRNGAGKSTLLKIITRITEPTSGVCRTRGRVGSLLEVGTGFHPELTGRENVFLNGAILGMGRREIARRFDEIIDFAGIERFVDTPVKRYSSGMYLRLAFAVAAHLDAEIMAVDEVLAVGDAEFQRRCLTKMGSLEAEGRTVVFVSHDLQSVVRLCRTAVWLEAGTVKSEGPTRSVADAYLASGSSPLAERTFAADGGGAVGLRGVRLVDSSGAVARRLHQELPFELEIRFVVREPVPELDLSLFIDNLMGVRVLDEAWSERGPEARGEAGEYVARVTVPPVLAVGDYVTGLWIGSPYETLLYEEELLRFHLEGDAHGRTNRITQLGLTWEVRRA